VTCNISDDMLTDTSGSANLPARFMQKKNEHKGVTIVEYAILLALIAIAIAVASPTVTSAVTSVFNRASSVMK
jgi:Flp pilus assembly pilin Flp